MGSSEMVWPIAGSPVPPLRDSCLRHASFEGRRTEALMAVAPGGCGVAPRRAMGHVGASCESRSWPGARTAARVAPVVWPRAPETPTFVLMALLHATPPAAQAQENLAVSPRFETGSPEAWSHPVNASSKAREQIEEDTRH